MQQPPPFPLEYSAQLVRSDGLTLVVHVDPQRQRKESHFAGRTTVEITRRDLGLVWLLDLHRGVFREMRLLPELMDPPRNPDDAYAWSPDGEEDVGGVRCVRLLGREPPDARVHWLHHVDERAAFRRRVTSYARNGLPRLTVDYRNVVVGPPPDEVYGLPPGLRQVGVTGA